MKGPDFCNILILASLDRDEGATLTEWMKKNIRANSESVRELDPIRIRHGLNTKQMISFVTDIRSLVSNVNELVKENV